MIWSKIPLSCQRALLSPKMIKDDKRTPIIIQLKVSSLVFVGPVIVTGKKPWPDWTGSGHNRTIGHSHHNWASVTVTVMELLETGVTDKRPVVTGHNRLHLPFELSQSGSGTCVVSCLHISIIVYALLCIWAIYHWPKLCRPVRISYCTSLHAIVLVAVYNVTNIWSPSVTKFYILCLANAS